MRKEDGEITCFLNGPLLQASPQLGSRSKQYTFMMPCGMLMVTEFDPAEIVYSRL